MIIEQWKPGTLYIPGELVKESVIPVVTLTNIINGDFESGDVSWSKSNNFSILEEGAFSGTWAAKFSGTAAIKAGSISTSLMIASVAGQSINIKAMFNGKTGVNARARLSVTFYSVLNDFTSYIKSIYSPWKDSIGDAYTEVSYDLIVPANAVAAIFNVTIEGTGGVSYVDDYVSTLAGAGAGTQSSFVFKAVQANSGVSGQQEPTWPTVLGNTVVDNDITWQAIELATVTWEAGPLLESGEVEPIWPTVPGASIVDGNIKWVCTEMRIEDVNCPHTRTVAIAASKIFAGDDDIVRFSTTLNPRDWTTQQDAGFLPTGLQQKGQVGVTAIGVYRGNLVVWSDSNFQVWQVDPDPAVMALLDSMEGIGSSHNKAVQPVSNDLFFLAALGVRTVGIAAASVNLATGDAGVPIDSLIQAEIDGTVDPIATYYPGMGQYWVAFPPLTVSAPVEPDPPFVQPPPEELPLYGVCGVSTDLNRGELVSGALMQSFAAGVFISQGNPFSNSVNFSDTKVISFTFAFVRSETAYATDGAAYAIQLRNITDSVDAFSVYMDTSGYIQIRGNNGTPSEILKVQITNNGGSFADSLIHEFACVIDLSSPTSREIYHNNTNISELSAWVTWTTYTDDTLAITGYVGITPYDIGYSFGGSFSNGNAWGRSTTFPKANGINSIAFLSFDDKCSLIPASVWDLKGRMRDPQKWEGWYLSQPQVFFATSLWRNTGKTQPATYEANDMELSPLKTYVGANEINNPVHSTAMIVNEAVGGDTKAT